MHAWLAYAAVAGGYAWYIHHLGTIARVSKQCRPVVRIALHRPARA
jgi:hypothetical protein